MHLPFFPAPEFQELFKSADSLLQEMRQLRREIQEKTFHSLTETNGERPIETPIQEEEINFDIPERDYPNTGELEENIADGERNKTDERLNLPVKVFELQKIMGDNEIEDEYKSQMINNGQVWLNTGSGNQIQPNRQIEEEINQQNTPVKDVITIDRSKSRKLLKTQSKADNLNEIQPNRESAEERNEPSTDEIEDVGHEDRRLVEKNTTAYLNETQSNGQKERERNEQITNEKREDVIHKENRKHQKNHSKANSELEYQQPEKLETKDNNEPEVPEKSLEDSITSNLLIDSESFENIVVQLNEYIKKQIDFTH